MLTRRTGGRKGRKRSGRLGGGKDGIYFVFEGDVFFFFARKGKEMGGGMQGFEDKYKEEEVGFEEEGPETSKMEKVFGSDLVNEINTLGFGQ